MVGSGRDVCVCLCEGKGGGLYSQDEQPAGRRADAGPPVGEDQGLYGVSLSLLSVWRPEGGGDGGGGLNVSGIVERVALQFREGDGRMLQVVEQHLDLRKQKTTHKQSILSYSSVFYFILCCVPDHSELGFSQFIWHRSGTATTFLLLPFFKFSQITFVKRRYLSEIVNYNQLPYNISDTF